MSDEHQIRALGSAVASALDAVIMGRPGVTALEVCSALGAVAGVTVAQSLPNASSEVDEIHLDAMTHAFRSTLLELLVTAREAREALLQ